MGPLRVLGSLLIGLLFMFFDLIGRGMQSITGEGSVDLLGTVFVGVGAGIVTYLMSFVFWPPERTSPPEKDKTDDGKKSCCNKKDAH